MVTCAAVAAERKPLAWILRALPRLAGPKWNALTINGNGKRGNGILQNFKAHVREGHCRESVQASDWVGHAVADVLGLNARDAADTAKIKRLLKAWLKTGVFRVEKLPDEEGEPRPFIVVA
jgi:hypothetical protein